MIPRWLSITGEPLSDEIRSNVRGMFPMGDHSVAWLLISLGQCTSVDAFEKLNQLGEGSKNICSADRIYHAHIPIAYGVVFRAQERTSSRVVALKQVRMQPEERHNGVPITALREISILRSLRHHNIVNVLDVAVGDDFMDEVYMGEVFSNPNHDIYTVPGSSRRVSSLSVSPQFRDADYKFFLSHGILRAGWWPIASGLRH